MSNKKNKKKRMSDSAKQNLFTILKSLIKNEAVVEGARHNPWWVAVIFFVVSIILPCIPIMTSNLNTYGSSFLSTYNYGLNENVATLAVEMKNENVGLVVNENHTLDEVGWVAKYSEGEAQYSYVNTNSNQYDFQAFYSNKETSDLNTFIDTLTKRKFCAKTTNAYTESAETDYTYTPNFIVFAKNNIYVRIFRPNGTDALASYVGDYLNTPAGYNFADLAVTKDVTSPTTDNLKEIKYVNSVFDNFKTFVNQSYIQTRNNNTTFSTLLALGIYAVLGVFMGLMVFILTRGKKNVWRILGFGTCLEIASWSMFTPALLALIMGFILPRFGIMFFIIFFGIRIMWLTMRQLRPQYN
jgi:maltodextrin utilization protein YvdJ